MLESQRLQIQISECRAKLNALADDAPDADRDALVTEFNSLESRFRAAVVKESSDAGANPPPEDGQPAEIRGLLAKASIANFLLESAGGKAITGPEADLRAALLGDGALEGSFPIDLLLPNAAPTEERADVATSVGSAATQNNQQNIAGRVFAAGSGDYLGIQRPTVPAGNTSYPVLTGGTIADVRDPGVALDAAAATISTTEVSQVRATARYLFAVEDLVKLRGLEEALAADLRAVLSDKLDSLAINGQAAVANTSPAVDGLISVLPDPANPGALATFSDYEAAYLDRVDGKYSMDGSNIRLLVNSDTFKQASKLQVMTSGDLYKRELPAGRFRASANMPDTASNIATALAYASGFVGFYQPVWRGVQAIRDPYSRAAEGQIALTLVTLVGQKLVDSNPYTRLEFQVSS